MSGRVRNLRRVNNARTVDALTGPERIVVKARAQGVPEGLQHNMLDAIGLGQAAFIKRLWR